MTPSLKRALKQLFQEGDWRFYDTSETVPVRAEKGDLSVIMRESWLGTVQLFVLHRGDIILDLHTASVGPFAHWWIERAYKRICKRLREDKEEQLAKKLGGA